MSLQGSCWCGVLVRNGNGLCRASGLLSEVCAAWWYDVFFFDAFHVRTEPKPQTL